MSRRSPALSSQAVDRLSEANFCQLSNGLRIVVLTNDQIPLVSLNAFVRAGKDCNPERKPGTALLTAHMLDEGTVSYDMRQLAEVVEGMGVELSLFSDRELSGVSMQSRKEQVPQCLELLAELLRFPTFPEERLPLERELLIQEIRSSREDGHAVGSMLLDSVVYRGTPLQAPVFGTVAGLRSLKTSNLRAFHGAYYHPANTLIVVVGDVGASRVTSWIERNLGDWAEGPGVPPQLGPFHRQTRRVCRRRRLAKQQVSLFLGHLGISRSCPDFHALQLLDVILGAGPGFSGRIPRRLRDEQGLAYDVYCELTASSGIYPGRFVVFAATAPQKREAVLKQLLEELCLVVEEEVSAQELEAAKEFLTGSYVFDLETNQGLAQALLTLELFELGDDYYVRYPEMIRSINAQEVRRVAGLYLDPVHYTTIAVGAV